MRQRERGQVPPRMVRPRISHLELEPSLGCNGGSTSILKGYSSDLIQMELKNNFGGLRASKMV